MAAIKAILWGKDELFEELRPYYEKAEAKGILEIVGYAVRENDKNVLYKADGSPADSDMHAQIMVLSAHFALCDRIKELEQQYGISRNCIIDGRIFQIDGIDLPELCQEGIAHVTMQDYSVLHNGCYTIYPRVYRREGPWRAEIRFGTKSYAHSLKVSGAGLVDIGNYVSMAWDIEVDLGIYGAHNYRTVSSYADFDCEPGYPEAISDKRYGKLLVGSDVWIGRGAHIKAFDWNHPVVIGSGAVIASDSVVVKSVPPYAIVGGNPAKIIKYRFPEDVREKLLKIKWWDWELEKIHRNFKYFKNVNEFVNLFDEDAGFAME